MWDLQRPSDIHVSQTQRGHSHGRLVEISPSAARVRTEEETGSPGPR